MVRQHLNDQQTVADPLRAGFVAFGSSLYDPGRLAEISRRAELELQEAGIQLQRTDPVWSVDHVERAVAELGAGSWDFLIASVVNWVEYRAVTRVLLAFRERPLVLYSYGGFTENGTLISPAAGAGSTALRFPLERWGFRFVYLFNGPDSPMDVEGVVRFGRAAHAARRLRTARVGLVGFNDMGLYSTAFDVTRLRGQLGPEVESVDLLELDRKMASIPADELAGTLARSVEGWQWVPDRPNDELLERTFRLYLATVALCRERAFDAISYKCVEGVASVLGVLHSVPSSLVATAGYPYVDENDVGNLVAELALKWISGAPVTFLEHYEHHPEWMLLGVDGFIPHQLIEGPVVIKRTQLLSEGVAHGSRMRTGRMTLACLAETGNGYRMHIVTGEAQVPPSWVEMGTQLPPWPSVRFQPDAGVRRVLDHVLSQHFAAAYGDWADELVHLCHLLDVEPVLDR
jgi:L-fucose isomerase-like protein